MATAVILKNRETGAEQTIVLDPGGRITIPDESHTLIFKEIDGALVRYIPSEENQDDLILITDQGEQITVVNPLLFQHLRQNQLLLQHRQRISMAAL